MKAGKVVRIATLVVALAIAVGASATWRAYRGARSQLAESRCDGHETFVQSQWMDTA